jgi:hypothetical protein
MVNNNMKHFYQQVEGFMNQRNTIMLDLVLQDFRPGGTWVELGSWMGRSAAYCVVELINRDKLGNFYCVDTWRGGDTLVALDNAYDNFLHNIAPIRDHVMDVRSTSVDAASMFADASVDFCYVDALHTYEGVMADLQAWWPKIRPGAHFAGDDYTKGWPGVTKAVDEFFGKQNVKVSKSGRCWIVTKPAETK